jgi:NAD-dependent dihydropyrimidine dehydrogenase PreA subunit
LGRLSVRSSTTFLQGRMFHACNVDHTTWPKDPIKRRKVLDERTAARRLQRLENPIETRNRQRVYNERYYYGKPETRERIAQGKQRVEVKEQRRKYTQTLAYKKAEALRSFLLYRPETWRHLTWKSHMPVVYDTKTKHGCASCHKKPCMGFRLWWKRHDNSNHIPDHSTHIYDCHACFVADWSRIPPIGYEDFQFGQDKTSRLCKETKSGSTASERKRKVKLDTRQDANGLF